MLINKLKKTSRKFVKQGSFRYVTMTYVHVQNLCEIKLVKQDAVRHATMTCVHLKTGFYSLGHT